MSISAGKQFAIIAKNISDEESALTNVSHETDEEFRAGIQLFNSREFFKAHEIWEALWLSAEEPEKTFLQGLIQCTAAFHHYTRGNRNGARSLLEAAYAKLKGFSNDHGGVNLGALRRAMREFLDAPANRPRCVPQPLPQIQLLASS
jgi:uncharacterized protein